MTEFQTRGAVSVFARRPGLGEFGTRLKVRTNFFKIKSFTSSDIFHYDLSMANEFPPKIIRKIYIEMLNRFKASHFGSQDPVFDGRRNLFTSRPLPFDEAATFEVSLPEDRGRGEPQVFKIKIKKVNVISMAELHEYIRGNVPISNNCLTAIMALDVIFRHKPSFEFVSVGRSFYIPNNPRPIFGGLEIWQGYYQACRATHSSMLINVDISATCFYQPLSLVEFLVRLFDKRSPHDFQCGIQERDLLKITKALKGLQIIVTHRGGTFTKRFKVLGISSRAADKDFFKIGEGEQEISVKQYFSDQYNIRLDYPYLPCVIVSKKGNKFPLEVCKIIPGQRYLKKLNEKQTADMIKFTVQKPAERANKINNGMKLLNYENNEHLREFGIRVDPSMLTVDARVLPPPTLNYSESSKGRSEFRPILGSWNMRDLKVVKNTTLMSWSVVNFADRMINEQEVQKFITSLVATCMNTGMVVPSPQPPIIHLDPQSNLETGLRESWLRAGNHYYCQPQLIICILPNTATPLYAEIKRVCDTLIGVSSQCVQAQQARRGNPQYCANVCLKMNVKLGGASAYLDPSDLPFISEVPTIVFGADVTHPGPGDLSRPSIATLVGSLDSRVARYTSSIRVQAGRSEVIADLTGMVTEILQTFYTYCGQKPRRILFYRDGVSDGQFAEVLDKELSAIKRACSLLEEDYMPHITFIVVKKRHHARFMPVNSGNADRSGNVQPGTVIEQGVTHPTEFDFFLQSHAGLQGTSKATHYHVLYDENNFRPDSLQSLTFNMCYLFSRATKSVSIVPPIYYAHLVAARARFHSKSGAWSDLESETSHAGDISTYGNLHENLQGNNMYFV